jgi:hypothetical protein
MIRAAFRPLLTCGLTAFFTFTGASQAQQSSLPLSEDEYRIIAAATYALGSRPREPHIGVIRQPVSACLQLAVEPSSAADLLTATIAPDASAADRRSIALIEGVVARHSFADRPAATINPSELDRLHPGLDSARGCRWGPTVVLSRPHIQGDYAILSGRAWDCGYLNSRLMLRRNGQRWRVIASHRTGGTRIRPCPEMPSSTPDANMRMHWSAD